MGKEKRPIKFRIFLTVQEKEQLQRMALDNNMSMNELFRTKTLLNRLPRRITKVAGKTYWQLTKISTNLNQIVKAIGTRDEVVIVDRLLLEQVRDFVEQVQREITELDLVTEV
jgi:hypothetical protein